MRAQASCGSHDTPTVRPISPACSPSPPEFCRLTVTASPFARPTMKRVSVPMKTTSTRYPSRTLLPLVSGSRRTRIRSGFLRFRWLASTVSAPGREKRASQSQIRPSMTTARAWAGTPSTENHSSCPDQVANGVSQHKKRTSSLAIWLEVSQLSGSGPGLPSTPPKFPGPRVPRAT